MARGPGVARDVGRDEVLAVGRAGDRRAREREEHGEHDHGLDRTAHGPDTNPVASTTPRRRGHGRRPRCARPPRRAPSSGGAAAGPSTSGPRPARTRARRRPCGDRPSGRPSSGRPKRAGTGSAPPQLAGRGPPPTATSNGVSTARRSGTRESGSIAPARAARRRGPAAARACRHPPRAGGPTADPSPPSSKERNSPSTCAGPKRSTLSPQRIRRSGQQLPRRPPTARRIRNGSASGSRKTTQLAPGAALDQPCAQTRPRAAPGRGAHAGEDAVDQQLQRFAPELPRTRRGLLVSSSVSRQRLPRRAHARSGSSMPAGQRAGEQPRFA